MTAKKKNPQKGGRPTSFKPEFVEQAKRLALLGATDETMAKIFGVTVTCLHKWKKNKPELINALKVSKDLSDATVVQSLYNRALGYTTTEDVVIKGEDGKEKVVARKKQWPPDTTACIFWLKNRQKDEWRDKTEHEHTGNVEINALSQTERTHRIAEILNKSGAGRAGSIIKGEYTALDTPAGATDDSTRH